MNAADIDSIREADELFAKLRGGNSQKLEIGFHKDAMVPVRLLSAREEAQLVARAEQKAVGQNLLGIKPEVFISYETMIATIREATSINGAVGISQAVLERMPSAHLSALFDQYQTITKVINPALDILSADEIDRLVARIREKKTLVSDCFTWQLAAIGKHCLEAMLRASPTDSGPGSL